MFDFPLLINLFIFLLVLGISIKRTLRMGLVSFVPG